MSFGRAVSFSVALCVGGGLGAAQAESPLVDAATVALSAGNGSNAIALANQALQDPNLAPRDRARVLIDRGLAHEMLGERDGALVDFTEAINARVLPPVEQSRAFYDCGVSLDELGRTDEAVKDYSAAISLAPRFAAALNNRGNAFRRLGKLEAARADYLASIAAGNVRAEYPNFGLGQIAEMQGQPGAARAYYQAALAANAQFSLADDRLTALGQVPEEGGRPVSLRPPPGVVPSPGSIALHPPTEAAAGTPGITLRPPPGPATGGAITLRPPGTIHLRPPRNGRPWPAARTGDATSPVLKPAFSEAGARPSPSDGFIQLGAWRKEAEATDAWNRIASSSGDLLAGIAPKIMPVDLPGKGRYYRLRAGPVGIGNGPTLCAALQAKGLECMVARD